jgi:hypothetical protein
LTGAAALLGPLVPVPLAGCCELLLTGPFCGLPSLAATTASAMGVVGVPPVPPRPPRPRPRPRPRPAVYVIVNTRKGKSGKIWTNIKTTFCYLVRCHLGLAFQMVNLILEKGFLRDRIFLVSLFCFLAFHCATLKLYRLHTAILNRPLSSAAMKEV